MSDDQAVNSLPLVSGSGLGRRAILQTLMAGAGAAVAVPSLAHDHPIHESLQDATKVGAADRRARAAAYKPVFLDQHLFETLGLLAETIVPGSKQARVAEFIDALLAVESQQTQRRFLTALGAMEGLALSAHRKPWTGLTSAEQVALLTSASTADRGAPGPGGAAAADSDHPRSLRAVEGLDQRSVLLLRSRHEGAGVEGHRHPPEAARVRTDWLERMSAGAGSAAYLI